LISNDSKTNTFYYSALFEHQSPPGLTDKRSINCKIFSLSGICAIICGADNWVAVEEFGLAKEE
jgi:hypothetical protein